MNIQQTCVSPSDNLNEKLSLLQEMSPDLVLVFGPPEFFEHWGSQGEILKLLPNSVLLGCSTAGEITAGGVQQGQAVFTAIKLARGTVKSSCSQLESMADSKACGQRLAQDLVYKDLRAVLVFGQGVHINGSALVAGMIDKLGDSIPISGGLAGDSGAFLKTWTLGPKGISCQSVVAVGLYGDALHVTHGSYGGWEPFGPARQVTRSDGNVLYELDGEPALDVYKRYLGEYARDLPASGLLFPFTMLEDDLSTPGLTRTILGVDELLGSLTLAGEINQGGYLKLMHASTDALIDGAETAARTARKTPETGPSLALLVSCVGRKLVMGDRIEEEIEAVQSVLGPATVTTGFYSYGEISPFRSGMACQLHNQTMTVTTLTEY